MRVLYFTRDYTVHDRNFLAKLAASGCETHYLRLEDDGRRQESRPLPRGVRRVAWEGGRDPAPGPADWVALVPALRAAIRRVRPDVLHAGPVHSCGFMAAMSGFRPLVTMSWGSDVMVDSDRDPLLRGFTDLCLRATDVFFCDCDAVRGKALRDTGYRGPVVQFPWGVDRRVFRPGPDSLRLRRRPGWEDSVVLLATRSWEPLYGTLELLRGFAAAARRDPRLRLALAGDGSEGASVRRFVSSSGLAGRVLLPGRVPHDRLAAWFRAADVYVSASHSDGSSISLLEAMSCGLPAVVTGIPANREWVRPGVNGWLFPVADHAALARRLLAAASDPRGRARMGRAGAAVAARRADWDRNFGLLLKAYRRAAA